MPTVQVYIDGGASPNPGPAVAGYMADDGTSDTRYLGERSNNYAEYAALRLALDKYRWEKSLEILTDSQLIKEQMAGNFKVSSPTLMPIYLECMQIVGGRKKIGLKTRITKIPREENRADAIVSVALKKYASSSTDL